jgi:shikimate dehydrogenase
MIGFPLGHVQTPGLMNEWFQRSGKAMRVVPVEVREGELANYMADAAGNAALAGLVVTTPLKTAICAHLDLHTPLVRLVGSANCVRFGRNGSIGANFDGFGFAAALRSVGVSMAGKRVWLAGCGGAGKAIASRVVAEGASLLRVQDPDEARVGLFIQRLRAVAPQCRIDIGGDPQEVIDIAINASPLGMEATDALAVPGAIVAACEVVADIVIGSEPTKLEKLAHRYSKIFVGGGAMVRGQVHLLRSYLLSVAASEEETAGMMPSGG